MKTFENFYEFNEFLMEMYKAVNEESLYDYYLHKSLFSDQSYKEFKDGVEANSKSRLKSDEEVLADAKKIIDGFNNEVQTETGTR